MAGLHHNGKNIAPYKREKILSLLRHGESISDIVRRTGCARDTITGIRDLNFVELREAKELLAAQLDQIAWKGTQHLHQHLDNPKAKLTPQQLVPIVGVSIEKSILLRADPTIHVEHSHAHIHAHITADMTFNDILANAPARELPPPPATPPDPAVATPADPVPADAVPNVLHTHIPDKQKGTLEA